MSDKEDGRGNSDLKGLFASVLLVSGVGLLVILAIYNFLPNWEARGQFGDSFGSLNAIFSGLAFAALIYTVVLQRRELGLQRTELELTRKEMAGSREAMEAQTVIQKAQFHAVKAQIRVEAKKAEIDVIKMKSEGTAGGGKKKFEDRISIVAESIRAEASALEKQYLP